MIMICSIIYMLYACIILHHYILWCYLSDSVLGRLRSVIFKKPLYISRILQITNHLTVFTLSQLFDNFRYTFCWNLWVFRSRTGWTIGRIRHRRSLSPVYKSVCRRRTNPSMVITIRTQNLPSKIHDQKWQNGRLNPSFVFLSALVCSLNGSFL